MQNLTENNVAPETVDLSRTSLFDTMRSNARAISTAILLTVAAAGCSSRKDNPIPEPVTPSQPSYSLLGQKRSVNLVEAETVAATLSNLRGEVHAVDSGLKTFLAQYGDALANQKPSEGVTIAQWVNAHTLDLSRIQVQVNNLSESVKKAKGDAALSGASTELSTVAESLTSFSKSLDGSAIESEWIPTVENSFAPGVNKAVALRQNLKYLQSALNADANRVQPAADAKMVVSLRENLEQMSKELYAITSGVNFSGKDWFIQNGAQLESIRQDLLSTAQQLDQKKSTGYFNPIADELDNAADSLRDVYKSLATFDAINQNWSSRNNSSGEAVTKEAQALVDALRQDMDRELAQMGVQRAPVQAVAPGQPFPAPQTVVVQQSRGFTFGDYLMWNMLLDSSRPSSYSSRYSSPTRIRDSQAWNSYTSARDFNYTVNRDRTDYSLKSGRAEQARRERAAQAERDRQAQIAQEKAQAARDQAASAERARVRAEERAAQEKAEKAIYSRSTSDDRSSGSSLGFGSSSRSRSDDDASYTKRTTPTRSSDSSSSSSTRSQPSSSESKSSKSSGFTPSKSSDRSSGSSSGFGSSSSSSSKKSSSSSSSSSGSSVSRSSSKSSSSGSRSSSSSSRSSSSSSRSSGSSRSKK